MAESTSEQREQIKATKLDASNQASETAKSDANEPKDSYVKLAMRNMVRKGKQSLWHFFLTTVGLIGLLVALAYLTKP
jgi:hypothetical protein